jgi:hypothetical protein
MPMDFLFTPVDKLSPAEFRKQIAVVNSAGWPVYVLSNHDIVRAYVRYGDRVHNEPIMHYGEEIGMTNNDPKRLEKFASRFR